MHFYFSARKSSVLSQLTCLIPKRFELAYDENIVVDTDHDSYCLFQDPPISVPRDGNEREIFYRNVLSEEQLKGIVRQNL